MLLIESPNNVRNDLDPNEHTLDIVLCILKLPLNIVGEKDSLMEDWINLEEGRVSG